MLIENNENGWGLIGFNWESLRKLSPEERILIHRALFRLKLYESYGWDPEDIGLMASIIQEKPQKMPKEVADHITQLLNM